jgi:hypothetical protein
MGTPWARPRRTHPRERDGPSPELFVALLGISGLAMAPSFRTRDHPRVGVAVDKMWALPAGRVFARVYPRILRARVPVPSPFSSRVASPRAVRNWPEPPVSARTLCGGGAFTKE